MKSALYYSITRTPYSSALHIVAITTESRRRWYGRDIRDNEPTNGRTDRLHGRFDTVEAAQAKVAAAQAVNAKYNPLIEASQSETLRLHSEREKAMKDALS